MKDRAGRGRGLQPTLSAHPQPCARPPATTTAAAGAGEPVRPAQPSQILPTPPLVKEPRPELLIGPRIVTPADRTPIVHDPTVLHSSRYAGTTNGSGYYLHTGEGVHAAVSSVNNAVLES